MVAQLRRSAKDIKVLAKYVNLTHSEEEEITQPPQKTTFF